MIIALDYDRTYTREPELFLKIVRLFNEGGHTVYVITMLTELESKGIDPRLKQIAKQVIATGYRSKFEFIKRMDILIDIWIDDDPPALFTNYLAKLEPPVTQLRHRLLTDTSREEAQVLRRRKTDRDLLLSQQEND